MPAIIGQLLANPQILSTYIILSFIIALLGKNKKMGFWGYFFGSLLLTPIIGLLLVSASTKITDEKDKS